MADANSAGKTEALAAKLYRSTVAIEAAEVQKFVQALELLRSYSVPEQAEPTLPKGGDVKHG